MEIWNSTNCLADEVLAQYGGLKENHEVIITEKWWSHLRFLSFANQLKDKFDADPGLMKEMR